MNVLAIDFSAKVASVAAISGGEVLAFLTSSSLSPGDRESLSSKEMQRKTPGVSSQLTPLIHATIRQSGLKTEDFSLIALTSGPGLFTGLRVGVVTAKTLAYAINAELIAVNTLEVLAAKVAATAVSGQATIRVAINAQRKQLFSGSYRIKGNWQVQPVCDNVIVDQQGWSRSWAPGDLVSGAGLKLMESQIDSSLLSEQGIQISDKANWDCDAVSVARVAIEHHQNGRRDDYWKLKPLYYRPSAAEEVRMNRLNSNE